LAALDRVKEEIAYLKLWQGILIVTTIGLVGWLITATGSANAYTFGLAVAAGLLLSFAVLVLHRQIDRRIQQLGVL